MTPEQLITIGLIASVIVQVLKIAWIGLLKKPKPNKVAFMVVALIVSVPVAYVWHGAVVLPDPSADLGAFAQALALAAAEIFAAAYVVYAALLEKLLAGFDLLLFRGRALLAP
jgi:hypothetical protein